MNIIVKRNIQNDLGQHEFVERKGVGHPDTLSDYIAETASHKYSKFCLDKFGKVANHWFDKVMIIGGESDISYGVGKVIKPYIVIFAGKVTNKVGKELVPVDKLLKDACSEVFDKYLTGFNPMNHMIIENKLVDYQGAGRKANRYQPESESQLPSIDEITELVSNDCNLISGYAPYSTIESIVLYVEKYLTSEEFKTEHPDTGWDIKVFGSRVNDELKVIINLPFLASKLKSREQYLERKRNIVEVLYMEVYKEFSFLDKSKFEMDVNPQDRSGEPYLTALGSAADTGDVGVVGRGNRLNGLITPMRPMSIEAPCGKNPVDHTGKIYGYFCHKVANMIYQEFGSPCQVHIQTYKGSPLKEPDDVLVLMESIPQNQNAVKQIIEDELTNIGNYINDFVTKNIVMC